MSAHRFRNCGARTSERCAGGPRSDGAGGGISTTRMPRKRVSVREGPDNRDPLHAEPRDFRGTGQANDHGLRFGRRTYAAFLCFEFACGGDVGGADVVCEDGGGWMMPANRQRDGAVMPRSPGRPRGAVTAKAGASASDVAKRLKYDPTAAAVAVLKEVEKQHRKADRGEPDAKPQMSRKELLEYHLNPARASHKFEPGAVMRSLPQRRPPSCLHGLALRIE